MPKVLFRPCGKSISVPRGTELLDAAHISGVAIESPCGGRGTCGKCIVRVTDGEIDSHSLSILPKSAVADGYVLACQTTVQSSDVHVEVPEPATMEGGNFTNGDETYLVRGELLPKKWEFDPLAVKWLIQVPAPQPEDGLSDLDRLKRAIQVEWGRQESLPVDTLRNLFEDVRSMFLDVVVSMGAMRQLSSALRAHNGLVTVTLVRTGKILQVIQVEPGHNADCHWAIAVDVGTTTVAVQLISLTGAKIMATRSAYNEQLACGLDVISRINYAKKPERLQELRARVLRTINDLMGQAARSQEIDPLNISNAVVSGNTTMIHLLLGMNPDYIRLEPYTPTLLEVPFLTAGEVGIAINPDTWICFSPNVGSWVGGDITAGLLCTDLATDSEEINLFIDIGTNGELVVGNGDFLLGCACSAGPAFEGGGIECGMRAAVGAIEKVQVDSETGIAHYATIGNTRPRGICGSGMIDLLANLLLTGWVDPAGKLDRTRESPMIRIMGRSARYIIARGSETENGEPIFISEVDIENIIRAKAAIFSACVLMLDEVGIGFDDVAQIYVAGGFGRYLDLDKAIVLGLVTDVPKDKFRFLGNASLMGSYMVVVSREYRQRQLELSKRMTYFDLSNHPGYMDRYTAALFLPHTDPQQFPSVAEAMAALHRRRQANLSRSKVAS